jgi:citrate/tricarballylate utilization protein
MAMSLLKSLAEDREEALRQYLICEGCRLCDNTCPVWPTLSMKPLVSPGEVVLLANLCYDHRDCYYACPYIAPHPFNVDVPQVNRNLRLDVYSALTLRLRETIGKIIFALLFVPIIAMWAIFLPNVFRGGPISFYNLMPKDVILASGFTVLAYLVGFALYIIIKYNSMIGGEYRPKLSALPASIVDWLRHSWFETMHYPGEWWSRTRLVYHLLIFYGFALDLIATILGSVYEDVLGVPSPFPLSNPTVVIGILGGAMLVAGSVIALAARYSSIKVQRFERVGALDVMLAVEVLLVGATGLLTLGYRLAGMAPATYLALLVHLTMIYALFVTALHSTTLPHVILRPYSLWIYNSVVVPSPARPQTHALVNLPGHKRVRKPMEYFRRPRR